MKVNSVAPASEVGKYLKKKDSDTSNAKKKSKHKHIYTDCLLINVGKDYLPNHNVLLGSYCSVCGKINNWQVVWDMELVNGYRFHNIVTDEDVLRRYSHLPKFEIENIYRTEKVDLTQG